MADTAFHNLGVGLVPQASVPATAFAEYKTIRNKFKREALGQLDPAIRARMVKTLDSLPCAVKFRNQGALDKWPQLIEAHDWSHHICDTGATPRATCFDCMNELCWQVDQYLHPHQRSQRSLDWPANANVTSRRDLRE
jgi:hypothetical protein